MAATTRDPDFLKTLERMYEDSKILFDKGKYYNVCYLCGYVVECALKYLLCRYGRKADGSRYTWRDVRNYGHNISNLNRALEDCLSITDGIPPQYRLDCARMCPYIFSGRERHPHWHPKYRYGECPAWDTEEYCKHYIEEAERVFRFISRIIVEGA